MVISGNNLVINGTTVEATDLTNVASITSDVQTQLNSKANTSTVNSQVWNYSQMPAGSVLQVVSTLYTTRTSYTIGTTDTDVPGGAISITPKANGSKFLIKVRYFMESNEPWYNVYNIKRNGSRVNLNGLTNNWSGLSMATNVYGGGIDNGSSPEMLSFETFDTTGSTAGTVISYQLVASSGDNHTSYINRCFANDGQANYENGTSEIIIMEIKG